MDFPYMHIVILTFEIWPLVKVMGHSWVIDNSCVKYIQIQYYSKKLWPEHWFSLYANSDLDLGDTTIGQGQGTPLGHGQQLCEILTKSNNTVASYGPDKDYDCVQCDLTLVIMSHGQQWCEISEYKMTVRSYGLDKEVW